MALIALIVPVGLISSAAPASASHGAGGVAYTSSYYGQARGGAMWTDLNSGSEELMVCDMYADGLRVVARFWWGAPYGAPGSTTIRLQDADGANNGCQYWRGTIAYGAPVWVEVWTQNGTSESTKNHSSGTVFLGYNKYMPH